MANRVQMCASKGSLAAPWEETSTKAGLTLRVGGNARESRGVGREMKHGFQKTVADRVEIRGCGVHSAAPARILIHPAEADHGVVFMRTGLAKGGDRLVEANWRNIRQTALCTVIGDRNGATISTVEHLMASLAGLGVDNALVEIDGPETPIMDGSAAQFVAALDCAGLVTQARRRKYLKVLRSVYVENGRSRAELKPADHGFSVDVEIDFEVAAI